MSLKIVFFLLMVCTQKFLYFHKEHIQKTVLKVVFFKLEIKKELIFPSSNVF